MGLKIGITGGIGVGKSVVTRIFKILGIPSYDADIVAKEIMVKNEIVRKALIETFGKEAYLEDGSLNREWLGKRVFSCEQEVKKLNAIVHPAVIHDGRVWTASQTSVYSIKEAPLLFESGSYKDLDYTILVCSPLEVRIKRVMERDHVERDDVLKRISKQMPEEAKEKLADFLVYNDDEHSLIEQVMELHQKFISK